MTRIKSFTIGLPVANCWEKSRRSIQPLEFGNFKSSLRTGCSSLKVKSMSQISQ
jgi:hypothetical protein